MKKLLPLFLLCFAMSGVGQTGDRAIASYSVNDKLIGLSNLIVGLSDCPVRSVVGKVRKIEREGDVVTLRLKIDKKTSATATVPLGRVSDDDRSYIFRHLITKNNTLRLSGYSCDAEGPFSAFSVDRVY